MCFLIFIPIFFCIIAEIRLVKDHMIDICHNPRNKIYVPVGKNNYISTKKPNPNFSVCRVQVISCPACVIFLKIWLFDLSKGDDQNIIESDEKLCTRDRLEITEPVYRVYTRKQYCARNHNITNPVFPFTYLSQTRGVTVVFTYSQEYEHPFTIEFTAKYNIQHIELYPNTNNLNSLEGTISTPFFPIQYPLDFCSQFRIRCSPEIAEVCRIKLVFTDHHIGPTSILEFSENQIRKIGVTTGRIFRPPIIVSHGPILSINFYANKASNFGFKANYSAVLGDVKKSFLKPKTRCGGFVKDYGGTIIMADMTNDQEVSYDCIWIIKPTLKRNPNARSNLYLKLVTFIHMGYSTELKIHRGLTSSHGLMQHVKQHSLNWTYTGNEEHTNDINSGFYVWLRGSFKAESRLAMSYTAFSFSHSHQLGKISTSQVPSDHDCYRHTDFLCHNFRCIDDELCCDGFDHCGDNSDESQSICDENENGKEHAYKPNYYFPVSPETYPSFPPGFFVAFCISFATFLLCSLFCSIVYRTKQQYDLNERLRAINDQFGAQQHSPDMFAAENGTVQEPPPEYEFPPSYHDVTVYNTIKKIIVNSKNVQNSAMQTETNDEVIHGCCSCALKVERVKCQHLLSEDQGSCENVRSAVASNNTKYLPSYQLVTLSPIETSEEDESEKADTKICHRYRLLKSTNNLIYSGRYSKSLEGLSSKFESHQYEKLLK